MTSPSRSSRLTPTERATIRMSAKTLEVRAASDSRVVVSARFAQQVARYLRRLLDSPFSEFR